MRVNVIIYFFVVIKLQWSNKSIKTSIVDRNAETLIGIKTNMYHYVLCGSINWQRWLWHCCPPLTITNRKIPIGQKMYPIHVLKNCLVQNISYVFYPVHKNNVSVLLIMYFTIEILTKYILLTANISSYSHYVFSTLDHEDSGIITFEVKICQNTVLLTFFKGF